MMFLAQRWVLGTLWSSGGLVNTQTAGPHPGLLFRALRYGLRIFFLTNPRDHALRTSRDTLHGRLGTQGQSTACRSEATTSLLTPRSPPASRGLRLLIYRVHPALSWRCLFLTQISLSWVSVDDFIFLLQ